MNKIEFFIFAGIGAFIFMIGFALYSIDSNDARLKDECMSDGHKEYECVSMLRHPVPTVIYTR